MSVLVSVPMTGALPRKSPKVSLAWHQEGRATTSGAVIVGEDGPLAASAGSYAVALQMGIQRGKKQFAKDGDRALCGFNLV